MAITHAQPGEVIDIRPLGSKLPETVTHALLKTDQFEVLRLILPAGKHIPPHATHGPMTVQCLEGKVIFTAFDEGHQLTAGSLLHLNAAEEHSVLALEDSSLLVTLLLAVKNH